MSFKRLIGRKLGDFEQCSVRILYLETTSTAIELTVFIHLVQTTCTCILYVYVQDIVNDFITRVFFLDQH